MMAWIKPITVFKLTFMAMNEGVKEIDKITKIVEKVPQESHFLVDLPEYCASNDENDVVEHG